MKSQLLTFLTLEALVVSPHRAVLVGAQDESADTCTTCASETETNASSNDGDEKEAFLSGGDGKVVKTDASSDDNSSHNPYVYPPPIKHANYKLDHRGDNSAPSTPSLFIRPIMRLQDVSVEEFYEEYSPAEKAIPIVFQNLMPSTFDPADWTREAIMEECGHIPLINPDEKYCANLAEAAADEDCHQVRWVDESLFGKEWAGMVAANLTELNITTLKDILQLQDTPEGYHYHLHDGSLSYICPPAVERIRVPKYFPFDYRMLTNDPNKVGGMKQEHWPDIFISKKGTGSPLHCDDDMSRFYFQVLSGKKLWRVMPPSEYWRASPTDIEDYYPSQFEVDLMNVDFETFPEMDEALVYEAILDPGDVIFVPESWAHQVLNLEDSIATSMNFVDYHGAPAHIRAMLHDKGKSFERSYLYNMMNSYMTPLDEPDRDIEEGEDGNYAIDEWLQHHHFYLLDVPEAVEDFVEYRRKFQNGLNTYRTSDGFPALHVAVMCNFGAVVEHLLENGASVTEKDYIGRTAKDVAVKFKHREIEEMLEWYETGGSSGDT